ncbi:MAG: ABC transporter ATP-binding protein [Lachnospiraceae bacterium]|nr:ABC transporter ATP-binding protein [Lachnospiraceae bacterium]
MINITGVTKKYDEHMAVNNLNLTMDEHEVFGLVGTNGAGKTTLLRMIAGVLLPDEGDITIDDAPVWDNPSAKADIFFIPDDAYFFKNAIPNEMRDYYRHLYPDFDTDRFASLMDNFGLDQKRRISGYSKGMKKQLMIIIGLCSGCKYLLCDETFDGLDPVMRQATKSLFAKDMTDRGLTPILTSHNLRELEDVCDHVGLLHQGGVLLSKDLNEMKLGIQKVQAVFASEEERERTEEKLNILIKNTSGRLNTYTIRISGSDADSIFNEADTVFYEALPLTLEEIFISETEVVGYDIKKIIEG